MANFKTLKVRGSFKASRLIGNADTATVILDNKLSTSGSITLASLAPGKYSYNHSTSGVTIKNHPSPGNDFFLEVIPVDLEANINRQIIHTMATLKTLDGTAQTPVVYERNVGSRSTNRYRLSGYGQIHFTTITNGHYEVNGISVSSNTSYYVALGTSITVKAVANENYKVTSFTVNGSSIGNTYTTTIYGIHNFSMSTALDTVTISITQPTGATISVRYNGNDYTSGFSMIRNKPVVVTITPTEKYNVNALYWNGVSISNGSTQTPTANVSITAVVAIKRISVELPTSVSNGSVSAVANGTTYTNSFVVDYGTKVTINAKANTGYHLNSLKNGSSAIANGIVLTATSTISISCTFAINIYTISIAQPASNGTITVTSAGEHHTSNFTVTHGTTITVVATPNTGYNFNSLLVNGSNFTSGNSMVVTNNVTVSGTTDANSYLVTITQPANGTVSAVYNNTTYTSSFYAAYGATVKVSISANTGYHVTGLTWNGASITSGSTQTVTGNLVLTGKVSINNYSVSFTNPTGAKFSVLYQGRWYHISPLTIAHGSTIKVQVDPDTGYQVDSVKLGSTAITNGSDIVITAAGSLTATASLKTYTVTISNPTGVTISATVNGTNYTNTFTAKHGTSIKYNVLASTGYDVTSFTYGGTTINNGDTKVLTGNVTVTAAATLKTYEVNIIQPSDGTIKVGSNTSKFTAKHFDSYTVALTPATGYSVKSLTWNSKEITNGSKQTITGATVVTGSTSAIPQTITITQPSNGTIKVRYNGKDYTSSFTVPYNSTITITATPDTGYKLSTLTYGGSAISSGASKTVTSPVTITGSFSILSNGVSFTKPANGSIKLTYNGKDYTSSIDNVTYGSKVKVTVSANTGYYIDSITANGKTITNGSEITVNSAINIIANIYLIYRVLNVDASVHQSYTLTLTKSSTYGGTLPSYTSTATSAAQSNLSVPYGTTYSVTYTADTGYNASAAKSGTITTNTNITHTNATLKYFNLSIGAVTDQTYTLKLTTNSTYGGTLPSYTSTATSAAQSLSVPYGTTYSISYAANTANAIYTYTASSAVSGTITNITSIPAKSATKTLRYYTLSIPDTSNQSYTLKLTTNSTYGGTLPSYTSTATKTKQTLSVPYGTTYSITYTGDTGYTAGAAKSGTVSANTTVTHNNASLTPYTVTITQSSNQTITVTCGGKSYTSNFTATYGQHWTASISPGTNYIAGTLNATSGTITGPITVSATAATIKPKLTLTEVANGYWTVNGTNVGTSYSAYYNPGTQLTVECFANEGYIKPTELTMS